MLKWSFVFREGLAPVAFVDDEDPVEEFAAYAAQPPFSSTLKKSQAKVPDAWALRNCAQVGLSAANCRIKSRTRGVGSVVVAACALGLDPVSFHQVGVPA
jgi:hypothetical protein